MQQLKQINLFTEDKQYAIEDLIAGYWLDRDEWTLKGILSNLPLDIEEKSRKRTSKKPEHRRQRAHNHRINFTKVFNKGLKLELKYAVKHLYETGEWTVNEHSQKKVRQLINYIAKAPKVTTLLEYDINSWVILLNTILAESGVKTVRHRKCVQLDGSIFIYDSHNLIISVFKKIYNVVENYYDDRIEWDKDVIDLRKAGVKCNRTQSPQTLNMLRLKPSWFRELARTAFRSEGPSSAAGTIMEHYYAAILFSDYLMSERREVSSVNDINRKLIFDYLGNIKQKLKNKEISQREAYSDATALKRVIELAQKEEHPGLTSDVLFYKKDLPKRHLFIGKSRTIPEEVVEQLYAKMDYIAIPWRWVLILMLCTGSRISEILTLKRNCVTKDGDGDWWLARELMKQGDEPHTCPIPREVAAMVRAIGEENEKKYGKKLKLLFPGFNLSKPLHQGNFTRAVNQLIREHNICDKDGKLWYFQSHQCRHYVACKWLEKGIELHFIQRFFGHSSPENTLVYARIQEERLKAANETFTRHHGRELTIDKTANVTDSKSTPIDLMSKMLWAQTVDCGICMRPSFAGECNAHIECYACDDYETTKAYLPMFEKQLEMGHKIIRKAGELGLETAMERQQKKNVILAKYVELLKVQDIVKGPEVKICLGLTK